MTGLIFHLIPHTHWDREWYLPAAAFQARLVAVVDELLERLHVDPGYRSFLLDGQTVLLEDYLRARPERESDVRALVKTGRLQVGPWYVLADEQIPSGEALVRNLLLGAADAERWGGRLDVLYSPDAFGHPAAWPTLAREFGIRYGVVWRGLGGEPLAALARRNGGRDRRSLLELAWRTLVQCQFHDTLAGCASDDVARAMAARLAEVEALGAELVRGSVHELVRHDPDVARERAADVRPALVLWNPAARPRGGIVVVDITLFRRHILVGPTSAGRTVRVGEGYRPISLVGPDGRTVAVQLLDRRTATERLDAMRHYPDCDEVDQLRVAFRAPAVPGLGVRVAGLALAESSRRPAGEGAAVQGRSLVNHWIEVALEPPGSLALHDRRTGERFHDVLRLEDGGDAGDTYTYCPPAGDRTVRVAGPITVRRLAAGPLVAALEARYAIGRRVAVRLVVMLHADSPIVRCILEIENSAPWHRLRARTPTGLGGAAAVAGTAFGSIARAPLSSRAAGYALETPVATAPAHRFVAAAVGRRGLALLAPGFFEYEWTAAGDLVVTLLRAVGELSRGDLGTRPGHAGWPIATPLAQCLGTSRVELAIVPVSQAELERGDAVAALWEDVFLPVRGFLLRDALDLTPAPVDVVLEGSGLVVSAVKPAQQGSPLVLRCYNATDRQVAGAWRFGAGDLVKSAHRVRADERESLALVLEGRGQTVRFTAEPHEIVTILVT